MNGIIDGRRLVIYSVIGVSAVLGVVWMLLSIGLGDSVPIIAVVMICVGTFFLDKTFTRDEEGLPLKNPRVVAMMRGALVLSAVSFATTLFGMVRFVNGSSFTIGEAVVGWFISIFFTLAVQLIMLFMSLELGNHFVRLRRLPDEYLNEVDWTAIQARRRSQRKTVGFGLAIMLGGIVAAMVLFDWLSLADFFAFGKQVIDGQGQARYLAGSLVLGLALFIPFAMGLLPWPTSILGLLIPVAIYLSTLSVSWVFSFDSFYTIVRSEEDESQRRGAITRETVQGILVEAQTSLDRAAGSLLNRDAEKAFLDQTQDTLDQFVKAYKNAGTELSEGIRRQREENRVRISDIETEITTLIERREAEIAQNMASLNDRSSMQAKLIQLEADLVNLQQNAENTRATITSIQASIAENLRLAKCEEFGSNDPEDGCDGTSGLRTCGPLCEGYKAKAKNLGDIALPAAEEDLTGIRQSIATKAKEVETAKIRVAALTSQTALTETGESPLALREAEIRNRYQGQIDRLRKEQDALLITNETRGDFSIDSVALALATFKGNPGIETAKAYSEQCRIAKTDLIGSGVESAAVQSHDCLPAMLLSMGRQGDRIAAAIDRFGQSCNAERVISTSPQEPAVAATTRADPTATRGAAAAGQANAQPTDIGQMGAALNGQNDIPVLRTVVNNTRACLTIANVGQPEITNLQQRLTETESIYLVATADMRSSLADLWRVNFFALGAAIIALAGDLMILALSGYAAAKVTSPLMEDTLRPDVLATERKLRRAAGHHGPHFSEAIGMQTFLSYLEERQIDRKNHEEANYRSTLNRNEIAAEDEDLVNDILRAIPSRYINTVSVQQPGSNLSEERTAIYQQLIEFMNDVAQSDRRHTRAGLRRRNTRSRSLVDYLRAYEDDSTPQAQNQPENTQPSPENVSKAID